MASQLQAAEHFLLPPGALAPSQQDGTEDTLLPEMTRAHHHGRLVHHSSAAPEGQQQGNPCTAICRTVWPGLNMALRSTAMSCSLADRWRTHTGHTARSRPLPTSSFIKGMASRHACLEAKKGCSPERSERGDPDEWSASSVMSALRACDIPQA